MLKDKCPEFLIPPAPIAESDIREQYEADVVVIGEGLSGLACALAARQNGADTLIITASKKPVGRGGSVFAAYSKVMAEHGIARPDLDRFYLQELEANSFQVDQRKWYLLLNRSEEAMNWLVDILRAHGCEAVLEDANEDDPNSPTYQPPGTHAFVNADIKRAGVGINLAVLALEAEFLAAGGRILRKMPARQLEKCDGRVSRTAVISAPWQRVQLCLPPVIFLPIKK